MPSSQFQRIGIIARHRGKQWQDSLLALINCLQKFNVKIVIEQETAEHAAIQCHLIVDRKELAQHCDLLIVIGGDGSLLQAAQIALDHNIPLLGINRGRLGFLTDITPEEIEEKLPSILLGEFYEESRVLIHVAMQTKQGVQWQGNALNEVVLVPGRVAHMIEFEIFINDHFVLRQRADGLIVATPTGSTAYALSGGGPIIHPAVQAVVLVPMFPHTLSSRPLVVAKESRIRVQLTQSHESQPSFSCDGGEKQELYEDAALIIQPSDIQLRLIHPLDYDYFQTLRTKLSWEQHLTQK